MERLNFDRMATCWIEGNLLIAGLWISAILVIISILNLFKSTAMLVDDWPNEMVTWENHDTRAILRTKENLCVIEVMLVAISVI